MRRVQDKVVVVTGGALGIGRATAALLAREGATVLLTDIAGSEGEAAAAAIRAEGGEADFLLHDVRSEADWGRVITHARRHWGHLDVLVNNAGIYLIRDLATTSVEDLEAILATNVRGVFLGMRACAPAMVAQGGGSIINMSSMDGLVGAEGHTAYGASKGAVRIMTKDAAVELAADRVRVNSIHPGYIRTRMAEQGGRFYGETLEQLGEEFPLGHIGEPEDVAWAVLYLASDESRWVTGAELVVDGGATAK